MLGVHASNGDTSAVLTAGFAGLVAGALSMAAGEYVSVSSQRDSQLSDLETEKQELEEFPEAELHELTEIYVQRGLDRELATAVAQQLTDHDPLAAHLRDELNITPGALSNPVQAAATSTAAFSLGAAVPVATGFLTEGTSRMIALAITALVALAVTGALGARVGGGFTGRASVRVLVGGGLAMLITAIIGGLVGASV
jgi:VIT1/CCC1 family predicted Fe2+/Mn2+ transporter